jgi:type II secretory pathway pseudopilin PulG
MEVLVALTIFLLSFVALGKLVTLASDEAVEVQYQSEATHMAQSKLNEVLAGSLPLSSQQGTIDEDPTWQWSVDAEQTGDVASLWTVKVRVWRQYGDHEIDSTLAQMVLDPSVRGSMFDQVVVTGSQDTASSSSTGTNGSSNNSSSGQQSAGGGTTNQKTTPTGPQTPTPPQPPTTPRTPKGPT